MKKPIIGITLDYEESGHYSNFPWYAIRKNYLHSIEKVGGIPVPLFHSLDSINNIVNLIDGLIITGGDFDIHPSYYSKEPANFRKEKKQRTLYEINLCEKSLKKNIPILGICGGAQLINVTLGGTLVQDIQSLNSSFVEHEQLNPRDEISHKIFINLNTLLYKVIGKSEIHVNSAHHQSVNLLGDGLITSSKSKDDIIESIESTKHKWCIGVQWHPEFFITESDKLIFKDLIRNSKK